MSTDFNFVGAVQLNTKYLFLMLVFVVSVPVTAAGSTLAEATILST